MFYYKQVEDGKIISVEAKSVDSTSLNFVKATKAEYDAYIVSLPVVEKQPQRDLVSEIGDLRARIEKLEKSKGR